MDEPKVQILVGKCPRCGATRDAAPDPIQPGMDGLLCGQGHEAVQYEVYDSYYMTREELAEDE